MNHELENIDYNESIRLVCFACGTILYDIIFHFDVFVQIFKFSVTLRADSHYRL